MSIVVGTAVLGTLAIWWLTGFALYEAAVGAIAMTGAAAVALLVPRRPVQAIGVVFFLAIWSRVLVDLPIGTMRLEQPAIAALLVSLVWHRRSLDLPSLRPVAPLLIAALLYLAVLTLSSVIVAEQPLASLRLVFWTGLSMAAGLAAALLTYGRAREALRWLAGSCVLLALVGLAGGVGYMVFGPGFPLVSGTDTGIPKVHALVYEPNLYASLLAAVIPLAAELLRDAPRARYGATLALLLLAIGLGVTRGAYIGLAVGLIIWFTLHIWRAGLSAGVRRAAAATVLAGVIGLVLPALLLDRPFVDPGPGPAPAPGVEEPTDLDTLNYRLRQVSFAMEDIRASPLIGMGAFSYGQRHQSPEGNPASIGVWPVVVLYDAGLVGLAALSSFFVLLARRGWQAFRGSVQPQAAVALIASVVVLLVSYLATSALHFAVTWLIVGCAVGATLRAPQSPTDR